MSKYTAYANVDPMGSDVIGLSRSPFTSNTFFSTTIEQLGALISPGEPAQQLIFGTGSGIDSSANLKWDGTSLLVPEITITTMTSVGVLHNSSDGELTSSLIINADISAGASIEDSKLATITTSGKVSNSATTATASNINSTIVARDSSGNFTAGTITASLSGNATTATTSVTSTNFNGSLSGDITGTQSATAISVGVITNAMINASAGIVDTKLATISTVGKVSNSATTATTANTASTIVLRDGSGNFSAGTITATLSGTATNFSGSLAGDVTGTQGSTVISADSVTNAKLANMTANSFKANNTGGSANPTDVSISDAKTMLGIVASVTIGNTQIGFGNVSSNLVGSANLTWTDTTKVLALPGGELNLGASTSSRGVVVYDASTNAHQYYGINVISNYMLYHVDQTASSHLFRCGLTTTTSQDLFNIGGNKIVSTMAGGGMQFGNSTASYSPTTLDYYEEALVTFTVGGCWSNRTVAAKLVRIGSEVTMRLADITAATVTANSFINLVSPSIPARFLPLGAPTNQCDTVIISIASLNRQGLFIMSTPNFSITDEDNGQFLIGEVVGLRGCCVKWVV